MKQFLLPFLVLSVTFCSAQNKIAQLSVEKPYTQPADWLIRPIQQKAAVYKSADGKDVILDNGLLRRSFRIQPNVACVDFVNLSNSEQLLRAVKPEAAIMINGKLYHIGGLYGQKQNAYLLTNWIDGLKAHDEDFHFKSFTVSPVDPYINWKPRLWATNKKLPSGKTLTFVYESDVEALKGFVVKVNYELYDGIPLLCKWVSVENTGNSNFKIDNIVNEILATPEEESAVVGSVDQMQKPHSLYIESNYAFNNAMKADLSDQTTHWKSDSAYTSQVNYNLNTPCLLEVYPKSIGVEVGPGDSLNSIRTYELLLDSYDRERNGLAKRKMYRTIAPWTTENPIFTHLISTDTEKVREEVDQCAATGYEGIILSFGSGVNMEDTSAANISKFKQLADYAHSKGVLLGGYSLFSSRRISDEDDVIDPKTGKPDLGAMFGAAPCMGSKWGLAYISKIKYFIAHTGFDIFENDGPYPGDWCASTTHPGHKGLEDSQWEQMKLQQGLYHWLNKHGVYVNAPDWYFLDGTNKIALGYREVNFSLPREEQIILNRQNIFDGTWEKTPAMGWGFVPLTQYQGGGAAATLEPLSQHLDAYEKLMIQYYGAGVQATYRGPRLYDTEATKKLVVNTIAWYKKHRDILNADVIHLRRADGRDWDGIMHVDQQLKEKALAMLYNPLKRSITRRLTLPMYYTGLKNKLRIIRQNGEVQDYVLDNAQNLVLTVSIPAEGYTWLIAEAINK